LVIVFGVYFISFLTVHLFLPKILCRVTKNFGCATLKWLNPLKRLSGEPRISRMTRICRTEAKEENRLLACTRFSYPVIVAGDEI
jgi:hypothetical protein